MATATMDRSDTDATSDTNVGNLFKFSYPERALITVMLDEYDKKAKSAWRAMVELSLSPMNIDGARSRVAVIKSALETNHDEEDSITLTSPLRTALGDACSLHARKLAKLKTAMEDLLVDRSDIEAAEDAVTRIANRIGEQLTLFVETLEEDE